MKTNTIEHAQLATNSPYYIDQLHYCLTRNGQYTGSASKLAGLTSFAFLLHVNRTLSAHSLYDYNWINEHWLAADYLGIFSETWCGFTSDATFPLYKELAMNAVKASVNQGRSAIVWTGQFEVICGYDDSKKVFFSNNDRADGEISYAEFGINATPYWFCQIFGEQIELWENDSLRESLTQAVFKWESHENILPYDEYACGERVYDFIVSALEKNDYDMTQAATVIQYMSRLKRDIRNYLEEMAVQWPDIVGIAEHYDQLYQKFVSIEETMAQSEAGISFIHPDTVPQLIEFLQQARTLEQQAINAIKKLLQEVIRNRFTNKGLR